MKIATLVQQGAFDLGVSLPSGAAEAFEVYYAFLEKRRNSANLTSITGVSNVVQLHFLDSLAALKVMDLFDERLIDIGSGAGFPGVPLKLATPTLDLTLLDSTEKRVSFMSDLCTELGIEATCIHGRAEEASRTPDMRETYDVAISRAVAGLNILCELCIPFLSIGGIFVAMKSEAYKEELDGSRHALDILGAEVVSANEYTIPGTEIKRYLIAICKTSATPNAYPRRYAKIRKSPLGSGPLGLF